MKEDGDVGPVRDRRGVDVVNKRKPVTDVVNSEMLCIPDTLLSMIKLDRASVLHETLSPKI